MRYLIFIYLFPPGKLVCVRYSLLNNAGISVVTTYLTVLLFINLFIIIIIIIYFLNILLVIRSSQSDLCANTGFGSFKLPTCDWLQKGRSHSHTESSLVFWLRCIAHGFTRGLRTLFSNKCLFRLIYLQVRLVLQEMHGFLFI